MINTVLILVVIVHILHRRYVFMWLSHQAEGLPHRSSTTDCESDGLETHACEVRRRLVRPALVSVLSIVTHGVLVYVVGISSCLKTSTNAWIAAAFMAEPSSA